MASIWLLTLLGIGRSAHTMANAKSKSSAMRLLAVDVLGLIAVLPSVNRSAGEEIELDSSQSPLLWSSKENKSNVV